MTQPLPKELLNAFSAPPANSPYKPLPKYSQEERKAIVDKFRAFRARLGLLGGSDRRATRSSPPGEGKWGRD